MQAAAELESYILVLVVGLRALPGWTLEGRWTGWLAVGWLLYRVCTLT